jgi:superoxide reductase
MVELNELYKCSVCGNIVELTHVGGGQLVCCGKPMDLLIAKSSEEGTEKHKPVIEKAANEKETIIKVGSIPHPMEEKHYIEFIEVFVGEKVLRKYLSPGEKPEMMLCDVDVVKARAYCNVHGLWKSD